MTVRFDFCLSDEMAEGLLSLISTARSEAMCRALEAITNDPLVAWWRGHANYLKEMQEIVAKGSRRL